jgi:hypothetical protein
MLNDLIAAAREFVRAFRSLRARRLRRVEASKNCPF